MIKIGTVSGLCTILRAGSSRVGAGEEVGNVVETLGIGGQDSIRLCKQAPGLLN